MVGIDAQFIATFLDKKQMAKSTGGKKDGWLETAEPDWALKADILMRHSCIPPKYSNAGMPIIMALHGRPESSFMIEYTGVMKCYQLIKNITDDPRYKAWISFWDEYRFQHSFKVPDDKLYYVPAMVDLDEYKPEGAKVGFGKFDGSPNIIIADMWRHDLTPYNMLYAVAKFKEKYAPDAKIQLFGVPIKKAESVLEILREADVVGNIIQRSNVMSNVYRAGDILVTPHNIATRIVRESLACGLPIVGGSANPYTDFKADPRDINAFAEQIGRCWKYVKGSPESTKKQCREVAEKEFGLEQAGKAVLNCCKEVLENEITCFKTKGDFKQKEYASYKHYLRHQKSKVQGNIKWIKNYDVLYRKELCHRLTKLDFLERGMSALCLGARTGAEVRAFIDCGLFAVGIDILPLVKRFVLKGDFQDLLFAPQSVDVVFTNSLDHAYDIEGVLEQIVKVVKPSGLVIIEVPRSHGTSADKWASCRWEKTDDLIKLFENQRFEVIKRYAIKPMFFHKVIKKSISLDLVEQICFRAPKKKAPIILTGYENLRMSRAGVINTFIKKYDYKSYLEIGVGKGATSKKIICDKKVGVDPIYDYDLKMTSTEYFKQHSEKFDIIFIDGLHEAKQVIKDIRCALKCLTPNGTIILHDCNPTHELLQVTPGDSKLIGVMGLCADWKGEGVWTGDVWKAFAQFRMNRKNLSCYVIDTDYGVGVIRKGKQKVFPEKKTIKELDYKFLVKNRKKLLDLRSLKEWEG
jgi:SAM-dependent methyltransferase